MKRKLRIGLAVAVGFALSTVPIICTVVTGMGLMPLQAARVCALLMWPGMEIGGWLYPDVLGHPLSSWALAVAVDTLIYSALFGLLLELLLFVSGRRNSKA